MTRIQQHAETCVIVWVARHDFVESQTRFQPIYLAYSLFVFIMYMYTQGGHALAQPPPFPRERRSGHGLTFFYNPSTIYISNSPDLDRQAKALRVVSTYFGIIRIYFSLFWVLQRKHRLVLADAEKNCLCWTSQRNNLLILVLAKRKANWCWISQNLFQLILGLAEQISLFCVSQNLFQLILGLAELFSLFGVSHTFLSLCWVPQNLV